MTTATSRLIADIGGTNARFALLQGDTVSDEQTLACAAYPDLVTAVNTYLAAQVCPRPVEAAMAIATPITGDQVKMTNHVWSLSIEATREALGFQRLIMLNDFTALAMGLPSFGPEDLHQVGEGTAEPNRPIALLGPGTGLGVSGLIPAGEYWVPLEGEGGHVTVSPADRRQLGILEILFGDMEHVSAEALICGNGLVRIYRAIRRLDNLQAEDYDPASIAERALANHDAHCLEALNTFCALLGTVAGNLVLTLGARGGVYIGGGIVPRLGEFFDRSPFRQYFAAKGRFQNYLENIPSFVIHGRNPAFRGLIRAFDQREGHAIPR